MKRIIFIGPPGCGKGTYASYCARLIGAEHISTGDIIRKEAKANTTLGNELRMISDQGRLVSDELIIKIISPIIQNNKSVIFDGFPRTVPQAKLMQTEFPVDIVISISMRSDYLIRKALGRRVCPKCNISFNIEHIDEPNFYMPAVLPTKPECIENGCRDAFTQRKVSLLFSIHYFYTQLIAYIYI